MTWGRSKWQAPAVNAQQQLAPHPTARCRATLVNLAEDPSSREDLNFAGLDGQSSDDGIQHTEQLHLQQPSSPVSIEPAAGSATSIRPVMPSEQALEPSSSQMASNIDYFWKCGSKV